MKILVLIPSLVLMSAAAFAGPLSGTYNLLAPCQLNTPSLSFALPAGPVVVVEGVQQRTESVNHLSVLVQSQARTGAGFALPMGKIDAGFRFGAIPFSVGAYSPDGGTFVESYFQPLQNGGIELLQTVRLQTATSWLLLQVSDRNRLLVSCTFTRR